MKIHLKLPGGGELYVEREPMPEQRARVTYGLLAGVLYVVLVLGVTAQCGAIGLLILLIATLILAGGVAMV